jgi:hypothetical protein
MLSIKYIKNKTIKIWGATPPASRVTGVQMMLLTWMQEQTPWMMTQWRGIWAIMICEASMRPMYIYFVGLVDNTIFVEHSFM